jgi:hypothetical protein
MHKNIMLLPIACFILSGLAMAEVWAAELAPAKADAGAPNLATLPQNFTVIFKATYTCRDKTQGKGCTAGCASASFSPLTRLTVVLGSIPIGGKNTLMYYYLAELPKEATPSDDPSKVATKAEGFILSGDALCGTVNMDLKFEAQ